MGSRQRRRARNRAERAARNRDRDAKFENPVQPVRNCDPVADRNDREVPPPPPSPINANRLTQTYLAGVVGTTAQVAKDGENSNPIPVEPFLNALREFIAGSGGYATTEEWLGAVEQSFRLSRIPEARNAELASTLFKRDACHWWATQERLLDEGAQGVTWARFVEIFQNRLMGDQQLTNPHSRVESLTQGNLSVRKNGDESLCPPGNAPDLVEDPRRRRARFITRLHPVIASAIEAHADDRIESLRDKAEFHEARFGPEETIRRDRPQIKGPSAATSHLRPQFSNIGRPQYTRRRSQKGSCYICGKSGHRARFCPQRIQTSGAAATGIQRFNEFQEGRGGIQPTRQVERGQDVEGLVRVHAVIGEEAGTGRAGKKVICEGTENATLVAGIILISEKTYLRNIREVGTHSYPLRSLRTED